MKPSVLCAAAIACSLAFGACGVTHPVRVLDEGRSAAVVSLGGPLVSVGKAAVPVPYLNAGYARGASNDWTLEANLHLTSLLFNDLGVDAGAATRLVRERGIVPELTLKVQGMYFATFNAGSHSLFLLHANLNASYALGHRTLLYAGTEHTAQFSPLSYFLTPMAGIGFPLSSSLDMQVESKWMAANHFTGHGLLEGFGSVGGHGSIGLFFGFHYALGEGGRP
ncbi:MAG: hypothetical protein ACM3Q4_11625 [Acidobacteriota bacterium]